MAQEVDPAGRLRPLGHVTWRHMPDLADFCAQARQYNGPLREALYELAAECDQAGVFCYLVSPSGASVAFAY